MTDRPLDPCPVCKTLPIPHGHAHGAEDLTPEAWPRIDPRKVS